MVRGLGIIGNCAFSALVRDGSVEWMCWPRPGLELRLRPAARSRERRRVRDRRRGRNPGQPGVRREHERPADGVLDAERRLRGVRLRAAVPALRPVLQAADARSRHASALRRAARSRPLQAGLRLRPAGADELGSLEPRRVPRLPGAGPAHDECSSCVHRGRAPVPARARPPPRPHVGPAARGGARGHGRALPRAHARLLAALGEGNARATRLPGRGHPLGARAQAAPVRGHRRAPRGNDDEPARVSRRRTQLGLPLLLAPRRVLHIERAGAPRVTRRRWNASSSTCATLPRRARACSGPRTG